AMVEHEVSAIYSEFVDAVAAGRKLSKEAVQKVAQGRVWSGEDARGVGLVDHIGGLMDAIRRARQEAGIPPDEPIDLVVLPEYRPHLALIDFLLPRKNGFALAEAIRKDPVHSKLPIIMMSGVFKNPKTAVEAREKYQVVEFLAKPIDMDKLADLIATTLEDV